MAFHLHGQVCGLPVGPVFSGNSELSRATKRSGPVFTPEKKTRPTV